MSLCVLTALAGIRSHSRDVGFEFTRQGSRWELTCRSGRLWVDNEPQLRREKAEFDARTAELLRQTHEAWGSAEWRRSRDEMDRLEHEHAALATRPLGHS